MKESVDRDLANAIVDLVLRHVEQNGRLEGRGRPKICVFPSLISPSGLCRPYSEKIADQIEKMLERTYSMRVTRPRKAQKSKSKKGKSKKR